MVVSLSVASTLGSLPLAYWLYLPESWCEDAECWLLAEWPEGEAQPSVFWIAHLPASTKLKDMVYVAKRRWHIERDYQELKQECGMNHYEGRGWRGLHHHWTLCIAAYAFSVVQRVKHPEKENAALCEEFTLPQTYTPRGAPAHATSRG